MLKQFFKMLSKQDLLTQGLNDTHEMGAVSLKQYNHVIDLVFNSKIDVTHDQIEEVRKQDYLINHFERSIRKKVFEHIAINDKEEQQLYTAFVLITIVNNLERIGDYSKNISEIAESKKMLKDEEWNKKMEKYSLDTQYLFINTLKAFKNGDEQMASSVIDRHFEIKNRIDADLIDIVSIEPPLNVNYASYALLLRYLKRICSHLMNISTSVTNPIDKIGYYVGDEDIKDDE